MKPMLPLTALGLIFGLTAAQAGPVQDFEGQLRGSYANYRTALFATNSGDAGKSAKALDGFGQSWSGLAGQYAKAPPPQYATDPKWPETMTAVQSQIDAARAQIAAGDLPGAHLTLEAVREEFGGLHQRNDMANFSDRMNDYHAAMEEVLALDLATTDAVTLAKHAGILTYLATRIAHRPAPEAAGNAEYDTLQTAFLDSVTGYDTAVTSGDAAAIKAAIDGLKVPYSKLFLKFG